jgi:hypothetical protein
LCSWAPHLRGRSRRQIYTTERRMGVLYMAGSLAAHSHNALVVNLLTIGEEGARAGGTSGGPWHNAARLEGTPAEEGGAHPRRSPACAMALSRRGLPGGGTGGQKGGGRGNWACRHVHEERKRRRDGCAPCGGAAACGAEARRAAVLTRSQISNGRTVVVSREGRAREGCGGRGGARGLACTVFRENRSII